MSSRKRGRSAAVLVGTLVALAAALVPIQTSTAGLPVAVETPPPYRDPSLPTAARVSDLLGRMTLEEKVGQMTQAERKDVAANPSLVTTWNLGSVLSGGSSVPAVNSPTGWADQVDSLQTAALNTRLGIPLLYGVDSVHGFGNLRGATVFPHNIGLGATRNPDLVRRIGHITAIETRASGPQWSFAPCLCVARDDRWGRTYESFGEKPSLVISMETSIDGLQGRPGQLDDADRVLATAKHYAGDGLTAFGTGEGAYTIDQGIAQVDRQTFDQLALSPYRPAIHRHHVGSIMPSFSSVDWTEDGLGNPVKMHASGELIADVLKGDMGFDGFVISDWQGIHQIPGDYATQVKAGVDAGIDMFMEPFAYQQFQTTLVGLVNSGEVSMTRIDDAVSRILTAKFELGLFEHPYTDRRNIDKVGSPGHRAVARQAVAESQVLLKNERSTLPLNQGREVYVAGANADNIGNQAGGWTLTWQGSSAHDIPGDTILDGIKAAHDRVRFSEDASAPIRNGSVGVVVVGETPYTEGFGDVGGPQYADNGVPRPPKTMRLTAEDERVIETVCAATVKCVVLLVSGRPLVLDHALRSQIDALVASWLPGSEGKGVADVLFGRRGFTGKLPVSWPRSVAQEPINVGDADYDPLYPYGWGLTTN